MEQGNSARVQFLPPIYNKYHGREKFKQKFQMNLMKLDFLWQISKVSIAANIEQIYIKV